MVKGKLLAMLSIQGWNLCLMDVREFRYLDHRTWTESHEYI